MQCNIDARGKRARLLAGIAGLVLAAVVAALAVAGVLAGWSWYVAGGLALAGGFAVFEARAGWCAARAMGIRTPV